MTVGRLLVEMDSAEFTFWHAMQAREARIREEEEDARERAEKLAEARRQAEDDQ